MFKLNMGTRGRMIDSTSSFPPRYPLPSTVCLQHTAATVRSDIGGACTPRFAELCVQCLRAAQEVDDTMPDMEPNTNLINFYKPDANFKW